MELSWYEYGDFSLLVCSIVFCLVGNYCDYLELLEESKKLDVKVLSLDDLEAIQDMEESFESYLSFLGWWIHLQIVNILLLSGGSLSIGVEILQAGLKNLFVAAVWIQVPKINDFTFRIKKRWMMVWKCWLWWRRFFNDTIRMIVIKLADGIDTLLHMGGLVIESTDIVLIATFQACWRDSQKGGWSSVKSKVWAKSDFTTNTLCFHTFGRLWNGDVVRRNNRNARGEKGVWSNHLIDKLPVFSGLAWLLFFASAGFFGQCMISGSCYLDSFLGWCYWQVMSDEGMMMYISFFDWNDNWGGCICTRPCQGFMFHRFMEAIKDRGGGIYCCDKPFNRLERSRSGVSLQRATRRYPPMHCTVQFVCYQPTCAVWVGPIDINDLPSIYGGFKHKMCSGYFCIVFGNLNTQVGVANNLGIYLYVFIWFLFGQNRFF